MRSTARARRGRAGSRPVGIAGSGGSSWFGAQGAWPAPPRRRADHRRASRCADWQPAERLRYLPPMTTVPLILDVDTGIDDSLAILYVAATPEAELVAVTCVGGNVDAHQVERNTRSILELAGRTDVEVALGRDRPLVKAIETTPETHGPQGLGHAELPPPSRPLSERHAVDGIIDAARR